MSQAHTIVRAGGDDDHVVRKPGRRVGTMKSNGPCPKHPYQKKAR